MWVHVAKLHRSGDLKLMVLMRRDLGTALGEGHAGEKSDRRWRGARDDTLVPESPGALVQCRRRCLCACSSCIGGVELMLS